MINLQQYHDILAGVRGVQFNTSQGDISDLADHLAEVVCQKMIEMRAEARRLHREEYAKFWTAVQAAYGCADEIRAWLYPGGYDRDSDGELITNPADAGIITQQQLEAIQEADKCMSAQNNRAEINVETRAHALRGEIHHALFGAWRETRFSVPYVFCEINSVIFPALSIENQEYLNDRTYLRSDKFLHELDGCGR